MWPFCANDFVPFPNPETEKIQGKIGLFVLRFSLSLSLGEQNFIFLFN